MEHIHAGFAMGPYSILYMYSSSIINCYLYAQAWVHRNPWRAARAAAAAAAAAALHTRMRVGRPPAEFVHASAVAARST